PAQYFSKSVLQILFQAPPIKTILGGTRFCLIGADDCRSRGAGGKRIDPRHSIRTPRLCRRIEYDVEILRNTSRVGASRLPCGRSRCHRRGSVRRGESILFYDEVSLCCRNWRPHCCRASGKVPPTYLSD